MISIEQIKSSLLFLGISNIIISFGFQGTLNQPGKRRKSFYSVFAILVCLIAIKITWDINYLPQNLYQTLDTTRSATILELRSAYKSLSKIYHPDKSSSISSLEKFNEIKIAYDVLIDEEQRDIYNRFGSNHLDFDPRKDEVKLLTDISVGYLFFFLSTYLMTLPIGSRASRVWIAILVVLFLALEVSFTLTETSLPHLEIPYLEIPFLRTITEYEVMYILTSLLPGFISILCCLSESLYVDIDLTSLAILKDVTEFQRTITRLLLNVEKMVEIANDDSKASSDNVDLAVVKAKITEIRDSMEENSEGYNHRIDDLKSSNTNPGSNYYWIVFVILYAGIYFVQ